MIRQARTQQIPLGQTALKRDMGLGSATILVVASMIGTGIFTTSGFIMSSLQNPQAMLLCWFAGGILALSGAFCYGELGAMYPKAGGEYVFLRESLGRLMGFLSGWISLIVGFSAPIAAAAMAFSTYFSHSLPAGAHGWTTLFLLKAGPVTLSPINGVAIAVIIIFSLVHWRGLHFGSRVQNLLTSIKIAAIFAFIAGGLVLGKGSTGHFSSDLPAGLVFSPPFAVSLIFVSFAYSGWNAAAYLGAEITDPARNIPRSLLRGTVLVMVLYLLLNVVFIYALPVEEMSGLLEVGTKSAVSLFGHPAGSAFSMAITVCLLSVISAMIMAGPRVYYAMAKDGSFFKWFGEVDRRPATPGRSIFLQAGIAILMVITSAFDKLLLYIGFTLSLFAMLTVLGLMVLRYRHPHFPRPYRTFGYPVTPVLFMLGNLWIIIFSFQSNPTVFLYGGGTILTGLLVFLFFDRITRLRVDLERDLSGAWSQKD
jgi:basic amino acid/polyamine antiporter, APA family